MCGAMGGNGTGRSLFQRLGCEKEPVRLGELGRRTPAQPRQRHQGPGLGGRKVFAQPGKLPQRTVISTAHGVFCAHSVRVA